MPKKYMTIYTILLPIILFGVSMVVIYFSPAYNFVSVIAAIIFSVIIYYSIVFSILSFFNFGSLKKAIISIAVLLAIFLLLGAYDLIYPPQSFGVPISSLFLLGPSLPVGRAFDDIRTTNYKKTAAVNTPDLCATDLKILALNKYVSVEPLALAKDADNKIVLLSAVSGVNGQFARVTRLSNDGSIDPTATFNNSVCFGTVPEAFSLDSRGRMLLYDDIEFQFSDDIPDLINLAIFDPKINKTVILNQPKAGTDKNITLIHPQFGPGDKIYAIASTVVNSNYDLPQLELVTLTQEGAFNPSPVLNLSEILKQYEKIEPMDFSITPQGDLKLYMDSKVYDISIADKKVISDTAVGNSDLENSIRVSSHNASHNFSFGAGGIFTASDQAADTFIKLHQVIIFNAGLIMPNGDIVVAGIVTGSAKSPVAAWQRTTLIKIKKDGSIDKSFGLK